MKNYFIKTPRLLHSLYRDAVWFLPNTNNILYLTFDDGPIPIITESCLDILKKYNVKATFFCVGENAQKHPEILERIQSEGHTVGNHSYHHVKGWQTENEAYIANVTECAKVVNSRLFRPPYGKAKRSQLKLLKENYKIILWDVLSGDFDPKNSVSDCVQNVVNNAESGSIIVMHDNEKCGNKMLQALPETLELLLQKGYNFDSIR